MTRNTATKYSYMTGNTVIWPKIMLHPTIRDSQSYLSVFRCSLFLPTKAISIVSVMPSNSIVFCGNWTGTSLISINFHHWCLSVSKFEWRACACVTNSSLGTILSSRPSRRWSKRCTVRKGHQKFVTWQKVCHVTKSDLVEIGHLAKSWSRDKKVGHVTKKLGFFAMFFGGGSELRESDDLCELLGIVLTTGNFINMVQYYALGD